MKICPVDLFRADRRRVGRKGGWTDRRRDRRRDLWRDMIKLKVFAILPILFEIYLKAAISDNFSIFNSLQTNYRTHSFDALNLIVPSCVSVANKTSYTHPKQLQILNEC
jgi:hypothetical protein